MFLHRLAGATGAHKIVVGPKRLRSAIANHSRTSPMCPAKTPLRMWVSGVETELKRLTFHLEQRQKRRAVMESFAA